jgi:hypothetical protein
MLEVCSRLAYLYGKGVGKDDVKPLDVPPGSDEYEAIYALTDVPEFYEWRSKEWK